jgi:hypothetical protein
MIRFLLVLVSLLIAVLAFALDRPWLYAAAGVPLVGALGLLGRQLWTAYRREAEGTSPPPDNPPLEDLGIMDVRPHDRQGGSNGSSTSESESPRPPETEERDDGGRAEAGPTAPGGPATDPSSDEFGSESAIQTAPATDVRTEEQPVLGPFLESLRAALEARTVGLFVQEDVILEYRIEACASTEPEAQRRGTFETQSPLLTATMSRQPVTVRRMEADDRTNLGYYGTPPAIEQIALAPVPQPDSASTVFLLADATAEVDLGASHARSLLERYADTVGMLRDTDASAADPVEDVPGGTSPMSPEASEEKTDQPRPRREIIAEEMTAADAGDDDLALVLVHLNRAESIARRGQEAVATAEHLLRTRLEHFAPGQRVERFGELTYGLFPRQGLDEVETWAADLQDTMAEETGELEGGVSVGVAVRSPRHDARELRADATEALREAYETGTCTIVA